MKPRRGSCRGCSHDVVFAQAEEGELLVLEAHESAGGPDRYAIWDDGTVHPVSERADIRAYPRHLCEAAIDHRPNPMR